MTKKYNREVTDNRLYTLSFEFPIFSFRKGVYTCIKQVDLIKFIRQIKDTKLQNQLIGLIQEIDKQSEFSTDIDNQKISKKNIKNGHEMSIQSYNEDTRR